jgi:hypothetical protein
VIPRPEDLDPQSQARIRRQVERASELSEYQRARLEALFAGDEVAET